MQPPAISRVMHGHCGSAAPATATAAIAMKARSSMPGNDDVGTSGGTSSSRVATSPCAFRSLDATLESSPGRTLIEASSPRFREHSGAIPGPPPARPQVSTDNCSNLPIAPVALLHLSVSRLARVVVPTSVGIDTLYVGRCWTACAKTVTPLRRLKVVRQPSRRSLPQWSATNHLPW
jgi:hypothetical protein